MAKFRKKPVVVEAVQWDETLKTLRLLQSMGMETTIYGAGKEVDIIVDLQIVTLEGSHHADFGDWIIKGVKGEFYPCKPDIFRATYEAVED